jgi:hypothetical protein
MTTPGRGATRPASDGASCSTQDPLPCQPPPPRDRACALVYRAEPGVRISGLTNCPRPCHRDCPRTEPAGNALKTECKLKDR